MGDSAYLIQQGETLTVSTIKPADPIPDAWPPSKAWPDGAWRAVPIEQLDAFLAVHAAETHADGIARRRAERQPSESNGTGDPR